MAKKSLVPSDHEKQRAEEALSSVSRLVKFTIAEYPVSYYVDRFSSDTGDRYFVPEYQRNLAWSDEQKSQFIESLLVGLPIPFLFFYQTKQGKMEIVDGSQRMRAMRSFLKEGLRLRDLILVPELVGFRFEDLSEDRRNKFEDVTIRTIVLNTDTDAATRAEMFARINKAGTSANEAEIRRGSLPGPVTNLIKELAEDPAFAKLTPLSKQAIDQREREELVTRFFAYVTNNSTPDGRFPGYRDRPKKFLYDYLKTANSTATDDPQVIDNMRREFKSMMVFVSRTFPNGFQKKGAKGAVPRVRFEAIAVGSAIALRENPHIKIQPAAVDAEMTRLGLRLNQHQNAMTAARARAEAKLRASLS